jgi:hypothetical protein
VPTLIETLAAELERPRELSAQVARYLSRTYDVDDAGIGPFLVDELPKLEDDEIDLVLSPLFTPKLSDQVIFAELLGRDSIPREQWPDLIQQLAGRPVRAHLKTDDGRSHAVVLREVTIERYVHRLRLDGTITEPIVVLLRQTPPTDRATLQAVARRAVWEPGGRGQILERYLTAALDRGIYRLNDAIELLNLVESYKPEDQAGLLGMIPQWRQLLESEINSAGGPKPFFSQRAEQMHGGDRDQRQRDEAHVAAKQKELAFLERLQQALAG